MMSSTDQFHSINRCLRNAVDLIEDGLLVLEGRISTPMGPRIVFANRTALNSSGYSADALLGQPVGILFDNETLSEILEKLTPTEAHHRAFWLDAAIRHKDGNQSSHRLVFGADTDRHGRILSYSVTIGDPHDILDESHTDGGSDSESLINKVIEGSRSESLALAAGGVAHDFKNALQSITSSIELARIHTPLGSAAMKHLDDADLALSRADTLARQMLAFTKGQQSEPQLISLADLLSHVTNISMVGNSTRANFSIADDLLLVEVDANQIQQVFQNIIVNACQAMPCGGLIQISAKNTEIPSDNSLGLESGSYVAVGVKDRGQGIPPEFLDKIFDLYFTTKEDGNGIGLAACREIIRNHGGQIAVDSVVGAGTEFVVFIPAYRERQKEARNSVSRPNASNDKEKPEVSHRSRSFDDKAVVPGSGCVLVVDDEELVTQAVEGLLKHLGYSTLTANNGADAIQLYRYYADTAEPIDAVLLDMTLPGGLSGREVMEEIRTVDSDARIIATSGHFDDTSVDEFLREGWTGVLPKPFPIERLSQTVAQAMQN